MLATYSNTREGYLPLVLFLLFFLLFGTSMHAVAAINLDNFRNYNTPSSRIAPPESTPKAPKNLRIRTQTPSTITFEFQDQSAIEQGIRVYRRTASSSWYKIDELPTQNQPWTTYSDQNLATDRYYCYYVQAFSDNLTSPASDSACTYTDRLPPSSLLVKRLRLLTYNMYGINDDYILTNPTLNLIPASHCEERALSLGKHIARAVPAFDIIGIQEYYKGVSILKACNHKPFLKSLISTGRYGTNKNALLYSDRYEHGYLLRPKPNNFYAEFTGGMGILTNQQIIRSEDKPWKTKGGTWSTRGWVQGIVFSEINVPNTELVIDTYNVHMYSAGADDCLADCRRKELIQLRDYIAKRSATSGHPVIIMGDFNIAGPSTSAESTSTEYNNIMDILGVPRDLWLENRKVGETGFTKPRSGCWVGSMAECGERRIDYIFIPTARNLSNNQYEIFVRNRNNVQVVSWNDGFGYHVSDHFGIDATIEIRKRIPAQRDYNFNNRSVGVTLLRN